MDEAGKIVLGIQIDTDNISKQLQLGAKNVERSTNSIFSGMGTKIGALIGTAALVKFSSECLSLGSNLTEVQNVVDTTFTTMNNDLNAWAKNALKEFGLSETKAKNYAATLGAMSQSMGMTEKVAYDMGTAVSGLAGDVASFYNLDADDAYSKLKGIWTGETEALKSLGVVMTQTALDQYALNNGFGKTTAKMTEQEKLMLRYQYVTNALSKTTGDFAKTQDSWANQTRILQLRWESIKATFGQGLINVLTPTLKLINDLAERVSVLAEKFSSFTEIIFGASEAGDSLNSISSNADGLSESINSVTSAAVEATKQLAGFDKITKIGSSGSDNGSTGFFDSINISSGKANETKKATEGVIGSFNALCKSFENLEKSFKPFSKNVGEGLHWIYKNVLLPLAEWTIGDALPAFIDVLAGGFDLLNGVLESFKPIGTWLWDNFLKPFAKWTGGVIVDVLGDFADLLSAIGNNKAACDVLAVVLGGFATYEVGKAGYKGLKWLSDTLSSVWSSSSKLGTLGKIGLTIAAAFVAADVGFKIGNKLYELLSGEDVKMSASMQIKYLSDASWEEIGNAFKMMVNDCVKYIKSLFGIETYSSSDGNKRFNKEEIENKFFKDEQINWTIGNLEEKSKKAGEKSAKSFSTGFKNQSNTDISNFIKDFGKKIKRGFNSIKPKLPINTKEATDNISTFIKNANKALNSIDTSNAKSRLNELTKKRNISVDFDKTSVIDKIKTFGSDVDRIVRDTGNKGSLWSKTFANSIISQKSLVEKSMDILVNSINGKTKAIKSDFSFELNGDSVTSGFGKFATKMSSILKSIGSSKKTDFSLGNFVTNSFMKIRALASGGYVKPNTPQLALIGDNKHQGEVVAPENKLKEMAMEAVRAAGNGYNREILATLKLILQILQGFDLNIVIDGKKLKDIIVDKINEQTRATGVCEITL